MKTLIDIGHTYAGIKVTWDDGTLEVFSDGVGSHIEARHVTFENDPEAAANECFTQASLLGLTDKLPRDTSRRLADWLAAEGVRDAS